MQYLHYVIFGYLSFALINFAVNRILTGGELRTFKSLFSYVAAFVIFFIAPNQGGELLTHLETYAVYTLLATAPWLVLHFSEKLRGLFLLTVITPILFLALVKTTDVFVLIGISYATFRVAHLGHEVLNRISAKPGYVDYLGFVFNPLTFFIGPISPYSWHRKWLDAEDDPAQHALIDIAFRFSLGVFKVLILALAFYQLKPGGEITVLSSVWAQLITYVVASLFFLFYVYCNFSGFNDISIALGRLIGLPIKENFNSPFTQKNVQSFWNHWHITLSHFARDIVYTPITISLARRFRSLPLELPMVVSTFAAFTLIGLWHGVTWLMLAFGLFNGFGVAFNIVMTKRMPKWWKRFGDTFVGAWSFRIMTTTYIAIGASTIAVPVSMSDKIDTTINRAILGLLGM